MEKEDLVTRISILLNKPTTNEDDIKYFEKKLHDDSVEELRQYLIKNKRLIGDPQLEFLQGLNDHGVDLILKTHNNIKIGFQIKSHDDVSRDNFASKVKAQMTESAFHGIHKLYILICSPYESGKDKYKARISHLLSELSSYKTNYHCTYSPVSCVGLFLKNEVVDDESFSSIYKQFTTEEEVTEEMINEIAPAELKTDFLNRLKGQQSIDVTNATGFIAYLVDQGFEVDENEMLDEIKEYCKNLKSITQVSREFFVTVLSFAESYGQLGNCINCVKSPYIDIQDSLALNQGEMTLRIKNLERKDLLSFDEDDPYEDGQIVIGLTGANIHEDLCISYEIREYLGKDLDKLKSFFVDLNFSALE
jgi:hypothetical protein